MHSPAWQQQQQLHHNSSRCAGLAPRRTSRGAGKPRARCVTRVTLYDLLGTTSSASTGEIRNAYRRLAARYHPDVNSSLVAHERFQALNLAAEVLTTAELRGDYDSRGAAALPSSRYKPLLDFLKQARGAGVTSVLGEPGADLSTVLGLDFDEAVTGSAATVMLDVLGLCGDCKGSGFDLATQAADCRVCRGTGEIVVRQWSPESSSGRGDSRSSSSSDGGGPVLTLPRNCPACRGSGKSDVVECKRCSGEGRTQLRRKVRFKVPCGVVDGQVLRVKGQGHSGKYGGAPGDLLVRLQVYDLADVRRHGYDLHSVLELDLYEALLGGSVPVRTVRGHRHIRVPAGTQHGQLLCVQGAGVARPGLSGVEYGHHYFQVTVRVPSAAAASDSELQLLQQLAAAVRQRHRGVQQQQQQGAAEVQQLHTSRRQSAAAAAGDAAADGSNLEQQQQQQQQQPGRMAAAAAGVGQHSSDPPEG